MDTTEEKFIIVYLMLLTIILLVGALIGIVYRNGKSLNKVMQRLENTNIKIETGKKETK